MNAKWWYCSLIQDFGFMCNCDNKVVSGLVQIWEKLNNNGALWTCYYAKFCLHSLVCSYCHFSHVIIQPLQCLTSSDFFSSSKRHLHAIPSYPDHDCMWDFLLACNFTTLSHGLIVFNAPLGLFVSGSIMFQHCSSRSQISLCIIL